MKVLCVTQGQGLKLFHALAHELTNDTGDKCGFVVTDSLYYKNVWLKDNHDFENKNNVLKEWDLTSQRSLTIDKELVARYENELGGPGVFGSLFADRRIVMGPYCAFQQDYRRRYSDEQLYSILQSCLVGIDKFLNDFKPDLIIGFICVTPIEYLISLFARARGIRYINLRTSRISNYFLLGSTVLDPSPEIVDTYNDILSSDNPYREEALIHIDKIRQKKIKYEGVVPPSEKPPVMSYPLSSRVKGLIYGAYKQFFILNEEMKNDGAIAPPLVSEFIKNFLVPFRAARLMKKLESIYVYPEDMKGESFAFFPLHTEPELQLLVYSRPYSNQIEAIRAIAMSLPAHMTLVIKEHPWMVGKRKWNYYQKLMDIPRVKISAPQIDTSHYVDKADIIITLGSSVGLDATMFAKPVITLGHCLYNTLPDYMVRKSTDLSNLPWEIRDLISNYRYDEKALCAFIGAVMRHGVGVNFYSVLLNKAGTHKEQPTTFENDLKTLGTRIKTLIKEQPLNAKISIGSVKW